VRFTIICIWSKEELPEEQMQSIRIPIYKKGDKADFCNYRGILLLPTMSEILSHILFSRLTPYGVLQ
jgi:hypothetical protein